MLSLADFTCTIWQEAEWRWRGVMRMRRTCIFFFIQENKHVISWCFSLLSFNLCHIWSIYFRASKFSYMYWPKMACKFQISKSLTVLGINRMKFFLKFTSIFIFTINNILNEHKCEALVHTSKFKINFKLNAMVLYVLKIYSAWRLCMVEGKDVSNRCPLWGLGFLFEQHYSKLGPKKIYVWLRLPDRPYFQRRP